MAKKSKWTDRIYCPISVLNHADGLRIDRFTSDDLDELAHCDDVLSISLRSSKMAEPLDLARLAHIRSLRRLSLNKLKFANLRALRQLPNLEQLVIEYTDFTDFEALDGFQALKHLFLWNNKLVAFPQGLHLPQLDSLYLSTNRIAEVRFAPSYPTLTSLHLDDNRITDVSPLAGCPALVELHLKVNPIATLAPLAGMKFQRLYVPQALDGEVTALQLTLPEAPYVETAARIEERRIARLMVDKNWAELYAITDVPVLAKAFSLFVSDHYDEETLRGVLAHPAPGALDAFVMQGLRPDYSAEAELLAQVLGGYGDRLVAPLTEAFHRYLAHHDEGEPFFAGKLKAEHSLIVRILMQAASPAFAALFLAFLQLRDGFSEAHLYYYKKLLDVVGKTQSPSLVQPLIDLLRFEAHIIGGDAAFMKKIFKAIGQLGAQADAQALAERFDAATEARPDVLLAYEAALARLQKKKA